MIYLSQTTHTVDWVLVAAGVEIVAASWLIMCIGCVILLNRRRNN